MKKQIRIAVLGDGGWGTTLAILLNKKGYEITLWGAFPEYIKLVNKKRENAKFLPGIKIPPSIKLSSDISSSASDKEIIVLAVPSQHMRRVVKMIPRADKGSIYVSASKGIENHTLMRMSEIITDELGKVKAAVLSGPTISFEVARGLPTAAVAASRDKKAADMIQDVFSFDHFRVYKSADVIGVEMGGSLKNIIAIAAGISDGLGFGANSKAGLLARGLVEITRLGVAMGAKKETFTGLSGLGDLVTTCISGHGRNRWFGEQIGNGRRPKDVLCDTEMAIEGAPTAQSAHLLAVRHGVEMPITEQIYKILYKNKSPRVAVRDLMLRPRRSE